MIADHVTHIAAGPAFTSASRVSWAIIGLCGLLMLSVGAADHRRLGTAQGESQRRPDGGGPSLEEDRAPALS